LGLTLAAAVPSAGAANFSYPNFTDTTGLELNGTAAVSGSALRLTSAASQTGTFFRTDKFVHPDRSFQTHFRVSAHDGSATPGEGMAFVLQREGPGVVGGGGGDLGYSGGSFVPSVAVEMDLLDNGATDPDSNHIAVTKHGPIDHYASADPGFTMYGSTFSVWVKYSASSKRMKVWASLADLRPVDPLLSVKINLKSALAGKAYPGFTGATSSFFAQQDILTWDLGTGS
jgi:hypothetical protein